MNPDPLKQDAVGMFNGAALVFMGLGQVGSPNVPLDASVAELVDRIAEFGIVVEQTARILPRRPGASMIQLLFYEQNIPYGGRRRVIINWYTRSGLAFMFADAPSLPC
jgi:hypothetical protein